MSKILIDEATVKLALEALEYIHEGANNQGPHTGISWRCVSNKAEPVITALRKALAEPDFWAGYVPEPVKPEVCCGEYATCLRACTPRGKWLANEALDKKAENARALGLDYEPAQHEPVAYLCENAVGHKYFRWKKPSSTYKPIALYASPPAQRTWVGLTDEEIFLVLGKLQAIYNRPPTEDSRIVFAHAIEAKLKEKNT